MSDDTAFTLTEPVERPRGPLADYVPSSVTAFQKAAQRIDIEVRTVYGRLRFKPTPGKSGKEALQHAVTQYAKQFGLDLASVGGEIHITHDGAHVPHSAKFLK